VRGERRHTEVEGGPAEHFAAVVVGIKVHVEGVDVAVAFVVDDDCGGDGIVGLAIRVGFGAFDPVWVRGHVVVGGKKDISTELINVVFGEWFGRPRDLVEVDLGSGVVEEDLEIGGHVLVLRMKIDDRR
jgi:hypothetical protein